jgi:hypothetical protein
MAIAQSHMFQRDGVFGDFVNCLWPVDPADTPLTIELEKLATFIGSLVTFLGVIATAASIYFHKLNPRVRPRNPIGQPQ